MTRPSNGSGRNGIPWEPSPEAVYLEAKHWVYERLALISSVIWVLGAAVLLATIVPYIAHPQFYIAIACVVPLVPAALPWLFYRSLARKRAARLLNASAGH